MDIVNLKITTKKFQFPVAQDWYSVSYFESETLLVPIFPGAMYYWHVIWVLFWQKFAIGISWWGGRPEKSL